MGYVKYTYISVISQKLIPRKIILLFGIENMRDVIQFEKTGYILKMKYIGKLSWPVCV